PPACWWASGSVFEILRAKASSPRTHGTSASPWYSPEFLAQRFCTWSLTGALTSSIRKRSLALRPFKRGAFFPEACSVLFSPPGGSCGNIKCRRWRRATRFLPALLLATPLAVSAVSRPAVATEKKHLTGGGLPSPIQLPIRTPALPWVKRLSQLNLSSPLPNSSSSVFSLGCSGVRNLTAKSLGHICFCTESRASSLNFCAMIPVVAARISAYSA